MEDAKLKHLLIVYHSQSGRNERLAYAARDAAAAAESGVKIRLLRAAEAGTSDIIWCDGILLFMPENFGAIAGGMKDFFDRTYYPVLRRELIRPYAVCICTGNDGSNALRQWTRIAKGYGWRNVAEPVVCFGEPTPEAFQQAGELAAALAVGLVMGVF